MKKSKPRKNKRYKTAEHNSPSKGEIKIKSLLFTMGINYQAEKEFDDLINPKTKAKLRLDFYLPDYNAAIEYDGSHHHTSKSKYHKGCNKSFFYQKYKDSLKDKYCKKNDIKLFRVNSGNVSEFWKVLKELKDEAVVLDDID